MLRKHGVVGKFVEFYGDGRRRGAAGQPRHDRQHEPGVRLHLRDLPDRRRDPALPAAHRPRRRAGRARRGVRQGAGPLARPGRASRTTPSTSSSTCPPSSRRIAGPKRPQDRVALSDAKDGFRQRPAGLRSPTTARGRGRRGVDRVLPGQRPPRGRPATATADAAARPAGSRRPTGRAVASRSRSTLRRRHRVRDRPRRRRHRRDHLVHQHLQPVGDDRRGAAGQERRRAGPDAQALGQDLARPGLEGRHGLLRAGRPHARTWRSSASTSSATAAPPASATPARCPRRSRAAVNDARPRRRRRCCPATATSRAASTPT